MWLEWGRQEINSFNGKKLPGKHALECTNEKAQESQEGLELNVTHQFLVCAKNAMKISSVTLLDINNEACLEGNAARTRYALMMEAVRTSETSVNFNVSTRSYIPEDS
jgi:hypothetical protein